MTLYEYEAWVRRANFTTKTGSQNDLQYAMVSIAGEVGELLNYYKKMNWHGKEFEDELLLELGDILHYAAKIAYCLESSLDEVLGLNVEKIEKRLEKNNGRF